MIIKENADFKEYRLLLLNEVNRMNETMQEFQTALSVIAMDVSNLKITDKFRSSLWGGLGGIITTVIITLVVERMINK